MCRWAPPCHRPLWKQHSALSVGRGVGCPCRLPSQDYPKTVCRKVHPKFAHLLTKQKINRQTLLQIVGVEFFEEKLEQFIYLSFFFLWGVVGGNTWVILWMKTSLGSSPVGSNTSNSSPKSQNTRAQIPYTSQLMNWSNTHATVLVNIYPSVSSRSATVMHKHNKESRLTLIGGCCEWQNSFTLFCRLNLASVKITH